MDLTLLEDFLDLADTNNFSRSALRRHISQPAFSRRIQALEEWVGVALVDRQHSPLCLTAEGVALRDAAIDIVDRVRRMREEIRSRHQTAGASIRIATLNTLAVTFIPRWLKTLQSRVGSTRLCISSDNFSNCLQGFLNNEFDLFVTYVSKDVPIRLNAEADAARTLGQERFLLVSAATESLKPLFRLEQPSHGATPYLKYSSDSYVVCATEAAVKEHGWVDALEVFCQCPRVEVIKSLAVEGY